MTYIPSIPEFRQRNASQGPLTEELVWKLRVLPFLETTYGASRIDHKFQRIPIRVGKETLWVDSIVYRTTGGAREPHILVKIKAENEPIDIEEAESYALALKIPFFLATNGKTWVWYQTGERRGESIKLDNVIELPRTVTPSRVKIEPLKNLNEFKRVLQLCHDIIWRNEGYDPAQSFDEMSKILFIKMYDERTIQDNKQKEYRFIIYPSEREEDVVARVKSLFESAKESFPDIFEEIEREYPQIVALNLKDHTLYEVVEKLGKYSLLRTEVDIKGSTYEFFLKDSYRGVMGQYFTPHQIVEFMVGMIKPERTQLVCDPACGSGGFVVETMKFVWQQIDDLFKAGLLDEKQRHQIDATHNLYGIDLNARMSWVAKMNMVMHGNGHGNIHHDDALADSKKMREWGFEEGRFDVVLTNPPFGSKVSNPDTLSKYCLGEDKSLQLTEILFLERCIRLVRVGGMVGIVLPDSVLSNASLQYVRDFLDEQAVWKAIISLPQETFMPYGSGVKASLVFLQRKDKEGKFKQGRVFMAEAENVGYDATGRSAMKRNDLNCIVKMFERSHEQIANRLLSTYPLAFWVAEDSLQGRRDVSYYDPKYLTIDEELRKSPYEVKELGSKEIAKLLTDGHHGSPMYVGKGVPYLRVVNIAPFEIKSKGLKFISEAQSKRIGKRCHVETGDVLVSTVGTIGVAAVVSEAQNGFAFSRDLARIVPSNNVNPLFLALFLNSELGKCQMQRKTTGSVQKGVYLKSLSSIKVPIPPRKLQDRIATMMENARIRSRMLQNEATNVIEEAEKQVKEMIDGKKKAEP